MATFNPVFFSGGSSNSTQIYIDMLNGSYPTGTGTTIFDLVNKHNGTKGVGVVADNVNGFLDFNGASNGTVTLGSTPITVGNRVTIEGWIKWKTFQTGANGFSVFKSNSANNDGYSLYQNTVAPYNKVNFNINTSSGLKTLLSTSLLNTGQWYHITVTYNQSNITMYINGVSDSTTSASGSIVYPSTAAPLLGGGFSSFFFGYVSILKIYEGALSSTQILNNFNANKTRFGY